MNKPNWNDAPKWAKWVSQDTDGGWWWSQYKPKWDEEYGWWEGKGKVYSVPPIEHPNASNTLEKRP